MSTPHALREPSPLVVREDEVCFLPPGALLTLTLARRSSSRRTEEDLVEGEDEVWGGGGEAAGDGSFSLRCSCSRLLLLLLRIWIRMWMWRKRRSLLPGRISALEAVVVVDPDRIQILLAICRFGWSNRNALPSLNPDHDLPLSSFFIYPPFNTPAHNNTNDNSNRNPHILPPPPGTPPATTSCPTLFPNLDP